MNKKLIFNKEENNRLKHLKNKKGISLIVLIITIIVIIILATAIMINLVNSNIIGNAKEAQVLSVKTTATDEVGLATYDLRIKENLEVMTQEDKRLELENRLRGYEKNSTVEISGTGFIATHRGYVFEISDDYGIAEKEIFDSEEWDKTATSDDFFEWDEAGTTIVGYKNTITNNPKVKIPSKCIAIIPNELWIGNNSRGSIVSGIQKIEVPETVTVFGECAFADFKDLVEINIPSSVTSIGTRAFYGCSNLTNITIPNSVTSIGEYAFGSCTALANIEIPNSVTSIGNDAFYNCTNLVNVTIQEGVTSIGSSAFYMCSNLTNITIPSSVTSIASNTFSNCYKLTSVTIPESVTSIGRYAFSQCESLTNITIPNSVTSIENNAFSSCTTLTKLIIPSSVTSMGYGFFWCKNLTIYCRAASKPSGWDSDWYGDAKFVWGYKGE